MKFTILNNKIENVLVFFTWPGPNQDKPDTIELGYVEDWTKEDPQANMEEPYSVFIEKNFENIRVDDVFA